MSARAPSVAEVLERAAELLSKPGAWGQKGYFRKRVNGRLVPGAAPRAEANCFCLVGALTVAAKAGSPAAVEHGPIAEVLTEAIGEHNLNDGEGNYGVYVWNDSKRRTQAEVVAKLREAAALARERGI